MPKKSSPLSPDSSELANVKDQKKKKSKKISQPSPGRLKKSRQKQPRNRGLRQSAKCFITLRSLRAVRSCRKKFYESELARLQVELVKMQYWAKHTGARIIIVFEGRDAAGKGGTIKRITDPLNPRGCRVVALGTPSDREKNGMVFSAVCGSFACGRGDRLLRSQLVQPGWGRACDGLLHREAVSRIYANLPSVRTNAGAVRHHFAEILVFRQ